MNRINTGRTEHYFPWVSRGDLVSFSSPDATVFGANPSSDVHIYPAILPSGAGLACFQVVVPDVSFDLGFYPAGLDWSADGSSLIFSLSRQVRTGGAFTTAADLPTGQTYRIDSSSGAGFGRVPGINGAIFPSVGAGGTTPTVDPVPSLEDVQLTLRGAGAGTFRLTGTGLDPSATYKIQSSTALADGSFGAPQSFTGADLIAGIPVSSGDRQRFFRLTN